MDNLKAEQMTGSRWRVLAIPFGGPKDGKDLDGEFFDRETDIKPHWFKVRPVVFHHAQDQSAKDEEYGDQELDDAPKDDGWWSDVWLNRSARYWAEIDKWLRAGKVYGSSGSINHFVRKSRNGHIDVWPHVEQTLTLTPANPYARITAAKAVADFQTAGIALDSADLDRLAADLQPDLPEPGDLVRKRTSDLGDGGDAAAMKRLADRLDYLKGLLRTL